MLTIEEIIYDLLNVFTSVLIGNVVGDIIAYFVDKKVSHDKEAEVKAWQVKKYREIQQEIENGNA